MPEVNMDDLRQMQQQSASAEMPRYKCHKEVWALKIKEIRCEPLGTHIIVPAEEGYAPFDVPLEYIGKHSPAVGGYYVVYADGYVSYSPEKAFEDGYTRV
jgi:hypothetical protein